MNRVGTEAVQYHTTVISLAELVVLQEVLWRRQLVLLLLLPPLLVSPGLCSLGSTEGVLASPVLSVTSDPKVTFQ